MTRCRDSCAATPTRVAERRRQAGFTMVVLMVILAIMAIWLGVVVQAVSFHMQREREAELIFRGGQYVEAIRLYRMRYGRLPMTLREIWEADPKVIRKRWKDPITNSTAWGLVHVGEEGQQIKPGQSDLTPTPTPSTEATPTPGPQGDSGRSGDQQVGPIIGVRSTSCHESIRVYQGRTQYCDWKFVFSQQAQRAGPPKPTH